MAVTGSDPEGLFRRIESLQRIGDWSFGPTVEHLIRDLYWDTADGALGHKKITLRLRELDGRLLLTTKGGGVSRRGLFRRRELEVPATMANWRQVFESLVASGALRSPGSVRGRQPTAWLEAAGLIVTQDRDTVRRARIVTADGMPVAEMAMDLTTYRFGEHIARFREVEIERLAGDENLARSLGERLLCKFPHDLTPSRVGKYSRGRRIERALRQRTVRQAAG
jgi:inorganic triphosphatase YgiF